MQDDELFAPTMPRPAPVQLKKKSLIVNQINWQMRAKSKAFVELSRHEFCINSTLQSFANPLTFGSRIMFRFKASLFNYAMWKSEKRSESNSITCEFPRWGGFFPLCRRHRGSGASHVEDFNFTFKSIPAECHVIRPGGLKNRSCVVKVCFVANRINDFQFYWHNFPIHIWSNLR